jgi:hypothetical protein
MVAFMTYSAKFYVRSKQNFGNSCQCDNVLSCFGVRSVANHYLSLLLARVWVHYIENPVLSPQQIKKSYILEGLLCVTRIPTVVQNNEYEINYLSAPICSEDILHLLLMITLSERCVPV